jgi:hypothetical protein
MPLTTLAVLRNSPLMRRPLDVHRHLLRQVARGHGADDAADLRRRLHEVGDQVVDGLDAEAPRAARVAQRRALLELALLADDLADAVELVRHTLVELDDLVEGVDDLPGEARIPLGHPPREVALLERAQSAEQDARVHHRRDRRTRSLDHLHGSPS